MRSSDGMDTPPRKHDLALLFLIALFLFVLPLPLQDIMLKAEARVGILVKSMMATGDYLIPDLDGEAYIKKPPLFHWLVLLGSKVFGGVNELTLRLPSAIAAMLCLMILYIFIREAADRQTAFLTCLITATHFRFLELAKIARVDMLLCLFVMATYYAAYRAVCQKKILWFYIAAIFAGLAFFTKGPVSLIMVALGTIVTRMVFPQALSWIKGHHILISIGLFVCVASPWYVYILRHVPEALDIFHKETLGRFGDATDHAKSLFYYPLQIGLDFMPWTVFVLIALGNLEREALKNPPMRFTFWIMVFFVGILSLSSSKQGTYLLPIMPLLSFWAARVLLHPKRASAFWHKFIYVPFYGMLIYACVDTFIVLPYWNQTSSYKPSAKILQGTVPETNVLVSYRFIPSIYVFYMEREIPFFQDTESFHAHIQNHQDSYVIMKDHHFEELRQEHAPVAQILQEKNRFPIRGGHYMLLLKPHFGEPHG